MNFLDSTLLKNKSIKFSLINIFGIGPKHASEICKNLGFSENLKTKHLTKKQINKLTTTVNDSEFLISTDLKKSIILANKLSVNIKSYKGLRKLKGLPVRGQRTHTNAKSSRKNRTFLN